MKADRPIVSRSLLVDKKTLGNEVLETMWLPTIG
jgi:hypothetical protein